jgi:L-amino acid N-acyltransferase YncA
MVRDMQPEDWPAVRLIYQQGMETSQATFETSMPSWAEWDAGKRPDCRLIAQNDTQIVGWAALSQVSRRAVYAGVAEVSVYVLAEARGQGVGHTLLQVLIEASERVGIWTLQSSVFPENEITIALHKRSGFRVVGRRTRIAQHHDVWRDTILLERRSQIVGT